MADFCSIFLSLAQNFHFPLATLEAISLAGCGSIVLPLTTDPVAFELPAFLRQVAGKSSYSSVKDTHENVVQNFSNI